MGSKEPQPQNTVVYCSNEEKQQGCCRRNIWIILGVLFAVLLALGAAVFFLFPRIPQIETVSADPVKGVVLKITSRNYIDYTVKSIKGQGTFMGESVVTIDKESFVIKARDVTMVQIPVRISSPLPKSAIQQCLTASAVQVDIHVDIDLKIISWTGKKIPTDIRVSVPCPEQAQKAASKMKEYGISPDQLKELEEQYGDLEELARKHGYM